MTDPRTDAIVREAARRLATGRSPDLTRAILDAAEHLGLGDAPRPGPGRVRAHARGMAQQALGDAGYAATIRDVWRIAEEVLTVLEEGLPDTAALLVGRAAAGQIDAGVTLHVRAYTDADIGDVAATLVAHGYVEPNFETADTRVGRLSRLRFVEDEREVVVTRCPPHVVPVDDRDLFTGARLPTATGARLRARLAEA